MGIVIFFVAVVVEITCAAYCIITKSNQRRVRSMIRIGVFIGFVLFIVLPIIDWSLRYYALTGLLFLQAVMGMIALIQKKDENREYKVARIVLKAIGMTVLIFTFILPAIIFPQSKGVVAATGEYQVLSKTYTYTDINRVESYTNTGRNRKLNVQLWYPDTLIGTYPLVVFSHGGFGIKSSNESLYNELASHGYVVCSIDHTYHCFYTTDQDGSTIWLDRAYMQELSSEDAQSDRQQSYVNYQKWMKIRTGDINFVIDYIIAEAENSTADTVYKRVDKANIGVMGHSLGGSAALGMGRIRDDIRAVIALESPFMCDIEGVEDGEFIFTDEIYPTPVLNVYSDSSWSILADRPQYAANYTLLSDTDATAFNVYISGVGHLTLTDFALTSPLLTRILDGQKSTTDAVYSLKTINKVSLEFFNVYLKGEGEFTSGGSF